MNFSPTLENKRVLLRPLQESDIVLLRPVALAQPELFQFMSTFIKSDDDLKKFVFQALSDREQGKSIPFIIIDKRTNTPAGSTRFGNLEEQHKRVEIGWTWLGKEFHNTGLNKAMKYVMLQYAFETMDMNRVEIKTNEHNQRSRRAIESIGGQYEGLLRNHMINDDGTARNTVYYSIIKEEWPDIKDRVFGKYLEEWY
ncbi:MAG: GNAT family protein [Taibaiella sp.]|jgi:RimJ/RimL family protein N-acetyltransferase